MGPWWIALNEERIGPKTNDEIAALRAAGKIDDLTLLWQEGWADWRPLGHIDDFRIASPPLPDQTKHRSPPEIPESMPPTVQRDQHADGDREKTLSLPLAKRWPRFLARTLDIYLISIPIGLALGTMFTLQVPGFSEWINTPGADYWFFIILLPFTLLAEAALYHIFGNTPGKALMKIKATTIRGNKLTTEQYLRRNFSVWSSGLACGLPLISLITYARQSARLGRGQQTSYDEKLGTREYGEPIGWFRTAVCTLAILLLLILSVMLSKL